MKNKIALVTGGTSGIGRATAFAFGKLGAKVIIASRNASKGKNVETELQNAGIEATWLPVDVMNPEETRIMMEQIEKLYGRIDYAFNNAACWGQTDRLDQLEATEWNMTIQGVLTSVFLCMKYELQLMLKNGSGAIVNNSSVDGLRGIPFNPAYCAAKHGVIGLTKAAAIQYSKSGIRINSICPGWIKTPAVEQFFQQHPEMREEFVLAHQPIGRLGTPEEVAEAVVWLCSDKASLILGTAFPVDGGYTLI